MKLIYVRQVAKSLGIGKSILIELNLFLLDTMTDHNSGKILSAKYQIEMSCGVIVKLSLF